MEASKTDKNKPKLVSKTEAETQQIQLLTEGIIGKIFKQNGNPKTILMRPDRVDIIETNQVQGLPVENCIVLLICTNLRTGFPAPMNPDQFKWAYTELI